MLGLIMQICVMVGGRWKGGGVEDWRDGRLEGWKGGRGMEGWKGGRVEGWKRDYGCSTIKDECCSLQILGHNLTECATKNNNQG